MPQFKVAVIVGSLRKKSLTRKVAKAMMSVAPENLACSFVEIGDLPLYNEDLDENPPASWTRFRSEIGSHDAMLFLTPEYNRSLSGCLKNAVDVASRPGGENSFDGKPAGVVSVTPYKLGAFGANHALRQTFVFLNMPAMQQPEAYIGGAGELFDDKGKLKSDETRKFLTKFMASFSGWVAKIASGHADFDEFLHAREKVAADYVNGDAKPLDAIVAEADPATFFPPNGGCEKGADTVAGRYDRDAKAFSTGGTSDFDVLHSGASGSLAYWTG